MTSHYLKEIEIRNVGPIETLRIDLPFKDEKPVPLVLVGENGSGKTIVLSHIVNALAIMKQELYDDTEVEKGHVFKYRSPDYIKSGAPFSYSHVSFVNGASIDEIQLNTTRAEYETKNGSPPPFAIWHTIPPEETSGLTTSFQANKDLVRSIFNKNCCLYFPVNRFEEPAWLNIDNLRAKASFRELKKISGFSNRNIISSSPLKDNIDWILDLVLDKSLYEMQFFNFDVPTPRGNYTLSVFSGYSGEAASIQAAINDVLRQALNGGQDVRFGINNRRHRKIAIMKGEEPWIPNIFQLSTGEIQVINIFLSIIRDYDLSGGRLTGISNISGIAVIDEIDEHLHVSMQKSILPRLIRSFPNVQFIITSHSPLFLLGMEQELGEDGLRIVSMPNGNRLLAQDFSEFAAAYEALKSTTAHRAEIEAALKAAHLPTVFVEGEIDIRYITRAAEISNRENILNLVQIRQADGAGNLDKIWRAFDNAMSDNLQSSILLLYDCDTNKSVAIKGRMHRLSIPFSENNPIGRGIENLLTADTIAKIESSNPNYIDTEETSKRVRGETTTFTRKQINKEEKTNLCAWLCEHGSRDDLEPFTIILDIIEEFARNGTPLMHSDCATGTSS
jgi:predicted ATP-binding protein involved in virulence